MTWGMGHAMMARGIADRAMQRGAAQKQPELEQLIELLLERRPRVVLEIGTMDGGTLSAWCDVAPSKALIVSVDLPGGEWGGGYSTDREPHIRGFAGPDQKIVLIKGDSHTNEIRNKVSAVLPDPIDFLFIDGDHSSKGVANDFFDYRTLVAPGGLVAFHDILPHPQETTVQVEVFWSKIKDAYRSWEFTVDGHERTWGPWGGIGVLEMP